MKNGFWEEYESILEDPDDPDSDAGWWFLDGVETGNYYSNTREINAFDFLHGDCTTFAQYLNERYRYPVEIAYQRDDDSEDSQLIHAYCVAKLPDGTDVYIDVRGINSDWDDFMREFYDGGFWSDDNYSCTQLFKNGVPDDLKEDQNSSAYKAAAALDEDYGYYSEIYDPLGRKIKIAHEVALEEDEPER